MTVSDHSRQLSLAAGNVFASGDPYLPKFGKGAAAHTLLAPTNHSMLDRTQFDAIGQAHAAEGGGGTYIVTVADLRLDFCCGEKNACYPIDFNDSKTYFSDDYRAYMSIESIIVPVSARWGVLISEEGHAIAAGSSGFIDKLLRHMTLEPEEMVLIFLRRWKELGEIGLPSPWVPSFLEAMYGPTEAARLAAFDLG